MQVMRERPILNARRAAYPAPRSVALGRAANARPR